MMPKIVEFTPEEMKILEEKKPDKSWISPMRLYKLD